MNNQLWTALLLVGLVAGSGVRVTLGISQITTYFVPAQGTFENPCTPIPGCFDNGPKTTGPETHGQVPTMTFTVRDAQPLYFFSTVGNQSKQGMVLGANTPVSGLGRVESYILAAGGNMNADTSNSTTPSTSNNSTSANNQTSTTSNDSIKPSTSSAPNIASPFDSPYSAAPFLSALFASFFSCCNTWRCCNNKEQEESERQDNELH